MMAAQERPPGPDTLEDDAAATKKSHVDRAR
jgi:hypothetical protein